MMTATPPSPAPLHYVVGLCVLFLLLSDLLAYDITICLTFPVSPQQRYGVDSVDFPRQ